MRLRRSIIVSAAAAAEAPLFLRDTMALSSACSSFSTVRIPLPMATPSIDRSIKARLDSLATISK